MRLREIFSEAGRNLASGTSRAPALALVLAVVAATLGVAEGRAVGQVMAEAAEFRSSGSSIIVLSAVGMIDGAACERLGRVDGIDRAGAVRDVPVGLRLLSLPDAPIPLKEVTTSFKYVLGVDPGQREVTGVVVSEQVSEIVESGPGGGLWTSEGFVEVAGVYPYPADGRSPELEYAIVSDVPAHGHGLFDQCWADVWPTSEETSQLLRLSLHPTARSGSEVVLSQLNPSLGAGFDGGERFSRRATSSAAVLSLLVGLALGYAAVRLRRLELAAARHAGLPARAQVLHIAVETTAWTAAAVILSMPALLYQALRVEAAAQPAVFWLELRCALGAATGAIVGALIAAVVTREHHLFRYFRER